MEESTIFLDDEKTKVNETHVVPLLIIFFANDLLLLVVFGTVPKSHCSCAEETFNDNDNEEVR